MLIVEVQLIFKQFYKVMHLMKHFLMDNLETIFSINCLVCKSSSQFSSGPSIY